MENLLLEEMKRCVELIEKQNGSIKMNYVSSTTIYNGKPYNHVSTNKDTVELFELLKSVRRHSVELEKKVYGKK